MSGYSARERQEETVGVKMSGMSEMVLADTFALDKMGIVGNAVIKFFHQRGLKTALKNLYNRGGWRWPKDMPIWAYVKSLEPGIAELGYLYRVLLKIQIFSAAPPKHPLKNLYSRGTTNIASLLEIKMSKIVEAYIAGT